MILTTSTGAKLASSFCAALDGMRIVHLRSEMRKAHAIQYHSVWYKAMQVQVHRHLNIILAPSIPSRHLNIIQLGEPMV
eukprot:6777743-Heterocapsa_arctica.AAC.1